MKLFKIINLIFFFSIFLIPEALTAEYGATTSASTYKINIFRIELCDSTSSATACNNSVAIYDGGDSGAIDIASTTAGAAAAALGNLNKATIGTKYTWMQVTMARKITIANRTLDSANELAGFAEKIGGNVNVVSLQQANELVSEYKFIINSTSLGMKNESSPISTEGIGKNSIVYDIIYKPINTDLIKKSKENGATIIYGYEMLLSQAACAFEIWHKMEAPYNAMKRVLFGGV